jgi:EAL domain-containing protein (putative c-di-GMP-specific phosphodiesterase class I)
MAHTLDLKVVAEGIEKEEQLNILKSHNCDIIQGYYFSKPVESHEIESMLIREKDAKENSEYPFKKEDYLSL